MSVGLLVRLEAKAGKEGDVATFISGALALVRTDRRRADGERVGPLVGSAADREGRRAGGETAKDVPAEPWAA